MKADLFSQASGPPVTTQAAEVKRVTADLQGRPELNQGPARAHALPGAQVLIPLTDHGAEREKLTNYRAHLATEDLASNSRHAYKAAFAEAISPKMTERVKESGLDIAFRHALKDQGGQPSPPFASAFLRFLPPEPDKARAANFDATYDKALESLRADVDKRFQDVFEATKPSPAAVPGGPPLYTAAQRGAIVRLLVGLVPFRAEEEVKGSSADAKDKELLKVLARDPAAFQAKLPSTKAYEKAFLRAQVVVGLRAAVEATSRRAVALKQISAYLEQGLVADRADFVREHRLVLDQVREQAALLETDVALLAREQELLRLQTAVVARRGLDVAKYEGELKESRNEVTKDFERVQDRSRKLFALRLEVRDAQVTNQKLAERSSNGRSRSASWRRTSQPVGLEALPGLILRLYLSRLGSTMTLLGKLLVLFNLAVSMMAAMWALMLYTNNVDWSNAPPKSAGEKVEVPAGKLYEPEQEIKRVGRQQGQGPGQLAGRPCCRHRRGSRRPQRPRLVRVPRSST